MSQSPLFGYPLFPRRAPTRVLIAFHVRAALLPAHAGRPPQRARAPRGTSSTPAGSRTAGNYQIRGYTPGLFAVVHPGGTGPSRDKKETPAIRRPDRHRFPGRPPGPRHLGPARRASGTDCLVDLRARGSHLARSSSARVHVAAPTHHTLAKVSVVVLLSGTLIRLLFMGPLAPLAPIASRVVGAALRAASATSSSGTTSGSTSRAWCSQERQPSCVIIHQAHRRAAGQERSGLTAEHGLLDLRFCHDAAASRADEEALHGDQRDSPTWTQSSARIPA